MLNSDLCLAYDNNPIHSKCMKENNMKSSKCTHLQRLGRAIDATAGQCCAWTHKSALFKHGLFPDGGEVCGKYIADSKEKGNKFTLIREECCAHESDDVESTGDCDSSSWPKGQFFV